MKLKNKLITALGVVIAAIPQLTHAQTQTELGEVTTFGEFISIIWAYGSRVIVAFAIFVIVF